MPYLDALDYLEKFLNKANSLLNAKTEQRSLKKLFCLFGFFPFN